MLLPFRSVQRMRKQSATTHSLKERTSCELHGPSTVDLSETERLEDANDGPVQLEEEWTQLDAEKGSVEWPTKRQRNLERKRSILSIGLREIFPWRIASDPGSKVMCSTKDSCTIDPGCVEPPISWQDSKNQGTSIDSAPFLPPIISASPFRIRQWSNAVVSTSSASQSDMVTSAPTTQASTVAPSPATASILPLADRPSRPALLTTSAPTSAASEPTVVTGESHRNPSDNAHRGSVCANSGTLVSASPPTTPLPCKLTSRDILVKTPQSNLGLRSPTSPSTPFTPYIPRTSFISSTTSSTHTPSSTSTPPPDDSESGSLEPSFWSSPPDYAIGTRQTKIWNELGETPTKEGWKRRAVLEVETIQESVEED